MAIRKKEEKPAPMLPADLQAGAEAALLQQVASKYFEDKYKSLKSVFFSAVEQSDAIELTVGESFRFRSGLFRWQERANPQVDTSQLAEAIQQGRLAIEAVLACVSKFNAESIKSLLPEAVSDGTPTAFGVMQATPEFKAQVETVLEQAIANMEAEPVNVNAA
jgi:hypothetical protein